MHEPLGPVARPPHPLDWDAYGRLQRRSQVLQKSFDLNGIERGLNRLLQRQKRKSSGLNLAKRLERDARKYLRAGRHREMLLGDMDTLARPNNASQLEVHDLQCAVGVIESGLQRLDLRHRLALTSKALPCSAKHLGIKARQLRNLLRAGREHEVWLEPPVVAAHDLLRDGLETSRYLTIDLCTRLLSA